MYELSEILKVDEGIVAVDGQSVTTVTYLPIAGYNLVFGIGQVAVLTTTKILTVQLVQGNTTAGGGSKNVGTAGTWTAVTATGLSGVAITNARAEEFDTANGFYYVGVTVSHDEGGNKITAGVIIRARAQTEPVTQRTLMAGG